MSKKARSAPDASNRADRKKIGDMTTTMDFPKRLLHGIAGVFFALATLASAAPEVQVELSSRFLARGELQALQIVVSGGSPSENMPRPPEVPGVKIEPNNAFTKPLPGGRRFGTVFQYTISSYQVGKHTIPPIPLRIDGLEVRTAPIEFTVFNPDDLQWTRIASGGQSIPFAAGFHLLKESPFEGESVPVELKLYFPADVPVEDWGIPEFERDGTACWRFEPSDTRGQVNLLGRRYIALGYPSTLEATRSGKVSIGGASLRLMTVQMVMEGFMRREYVPLNLSIPKLEFNARKLPPGAPSGFTNAIGRFSLNATSQQSEIREGDPVTVEIAISGTGNLDSLEAPKPVDASGWKIYETSANPRGSERRYESGTIVFQQFMRPLDAKGEIPAFKLVYFDPTTERYETAFSKAIPLTVLPGVKTPAAGSIAAAPPQVVGQPVERMTDILGLVSPALDSSSGWWASLPWWTGHAIAAALALVLIARILWLRFAPRWRPDAERLARRKALAALERTATPTDADFLRRAGSFIESWLGTQVASDASLQAILEERDAHCFRADKPADPPNRARRTRILRTLRKAAWLWPFVIAVVLTPVSTIRAEETYEAPAAYEAGDYNRAAKLWFDSAPYETLNADTLYNIGNAAYRLDSPGHAALYYRRALVRDSSHAEARQNLRFLERKLGSVSIHRPDYQLQLAKLRLETWQGFVWAGAWLFVLGLLVFPATRRGSKLRIVGIFACLLGPLLASIGGLGWHYYPDDSQFAPLARQAVIIGEKAALHTDAARTSPEVIDAPMGSLCEVIKRSGRWAYVGFATKTRGWIPVEMIEPVVPDSPPRSLNLRKPKANENDA
jgi:hypothetical protein